jgi:uncharacterized protein (DUF4415 family)
MGRELKALSKKSEADIDLSDIPEIGDWSHAVVGKFYRPIKRPISIRVDADVLSWFRALGGKYQSGMNRALREYMQRHRSQNKVSKRATAHGR